MTKPKTLQEIREEYAKVKYPLYKNWNDACRRNGIEQEDVDQIATLYAEQQAKGFSDWMLKKDVGFDTSAELWFIMGEEKHYTTSELYKIFLTNQ